MEKVYRNINYLFVGILVLVFAGFFKTYFGLFPTFKGLPIMAHLHAIAFLLWFTLLITQPILIKQQKIMLHKLLGHLSYLIVPMLIFTTIGMLQLAYERDIKTTPREEILGGFIVTFFDLLLLSTFYLIAILNTKNLALHIRFMVATSLVLLAPGAGRLYFYLFGQMPALILSLATIYGTLISLLIFDKIKLKRKVVTNPYLFVIGMFLMEHIAYFTLAQSQTWQWIADKIVKYLFF